VARPAEPGAPSSDDDLPGLPGGWQIVRREGPGRFTTRAVLRRADGALVEWTSRRHRKGLGLRALAADAATTRTSVPGRTWAMAVMFSVGSLCFAVGSLPAYVEAVPARVDGMTFFVGSVFFTAASYVAYAEVANRPDHLSGGPRRHLRLLVWRPRSIDWWSTSVQLVGTVFFNVMTLLALGQSWTAAQEDRLVWRPDAMGSVCFLTASYLAWAEVCHSVGRMRWRDVSWWVVVLNLLGSAWFGVSAVAACVEPSSGSVLSLRWDAVGTVAGAVCFLVAAVLLVPEARGRAATS
jgi:hypothetical protein